jgi:hypothetical protein
MKKVYIFTIATIVIFSTLTVSCSDEFVNRDVAYSIDSEIILILNLIMTMR